MSMLKSLSNLRPKKRFGQHFLHDQNIIHNIITAIKPLPDDLLIEIGPGQGALTFPLLRLLDRLLAIELDHDLIPALQAHGGQKLRLLEQDILTVDFKTLSDFLHRHQCTYSTQELASYAASAPLLPENESAFNSAINAQNPQAQNQKLRIVGNLPYNISTPILFHLLQYKDLIQDMHFMLQKEVVERMAAAPGSKAYGRLSVMIQIYCEVTPLFTVPPSSFTPPPKVDSMVVRLKPYVPARFKLNEPERFAALVKLAFQARRKTLKNALQSLQINLPSNLARMRAENLSIDDYITLSEQ